MITKVRLRNWKSHLDSEFNFSRGVNALIGIMGSGKSSVMDGISFALYGTFPALHSKKITLNDLIMKKPQSKNRAEVELEFAADGKTYSVRRVIERDRGTSDAEIREDGRILDVNSQAVTREVERVLQMDYELFSRAVYSEQNGLDYFLRIPKGNRMQQIDRMLKVDRFESVRERAVSISNRIEAGRKEKVRMVSELEKENLEEKIRKLDEDISGLGEKIVSLGKKAEKAKEERGGLEEKVMVFEDRENRINEIKQEIEGLKSGIKEIESNLRKKRELLKGRDLSRLGKELEGLEKGIESLEKDLKERNDNLLKGRNQVASLNTEIKLILESLEEIEKLGDKCPVCESVITSKKRGEIVDGRKRKEQEIRKNIKTVVSELEGMKGDIDSLEENLKKSIVEREKINSLLDDYGFIKELEGRKKEYGNKSSRLNRELGKLRRETAGVDIKNMRRELRDRLAEEREALARLESLKETIADKDSLLKDLKERESMLERYRQEIRGDERMVDELHRFVKTLKLTQDTLREEFLKTVNHVMKRVWDELYPYGDFTDIRLTIDRDYVLQLRETGGWIPVDGIASGGERSMASMALRIAFSLAFIPNLRWLILDEPTHNLDSNAIEQFIDILREKMSGFAEQVFLITHDERISEGVGGSLYKLERNKDANEPSRIVEM